MTYIFLSYISLAPPVRDRGGSGTPSARLNSVSYPQCATQVCLIIANFNLDWLISADFGLDSLISDTLLQTTLSLLTAVLISKASRNHPMYCCQSQRLVNKITTEQLYARSLLFALIKRDLAGFTGLDHCFFPAYQHYIR